MSRPPFLLQFRTSIGMYRKIDFLLNKVKLGNHERHVDWFRKQVN
jgi:hypothetical protein